MQGPVPAHTPTTPTPTSGDPRMMNMMNDYNMRLQHQQLQLNMNHSYNQLYQQQQEMERMRVRLASSELKARGAFHSRKRCQQLRTFANNFKWNELFAATVGERWQL